LIQPNADEDYPGANGRESVPSKLYRNLTGGLAIYQVKFRDVSFETGIDGMVGPGLGIVPADFNGDEISNPCHSQTS